MNEFGKYIKKVRETKGMSLNQVALYSDISAAQLSRIENGKRGVPKPSTIKGISEALKLDYNELMKKAGHIKSDYTIPNEQDSNTDNLVVLTPEEHKILEEIKKYPVAFHDLLSDPERNIKKLISLWEIIKSQLDEMDKDNKEE